MSVSSNQNPKLKVSPPLAVLLPIIIALVIWQQNKQAENDPVPPAAAEQTMEPASDSVDITIHPQGQAPQVAPKPQVTQDFLKEIGRETFESPAGLVYRSGSADGHRLDHIMAHSKDIPSKPIHGVFDGDRNEILMLIDEVWTMSQKRGPPDVEIKKERGRTVITAKLNRVVGYTGGESGKRKNYPKCSGVRLVVEGRNVITAFPVL